MLTGIILTKNEEKEIIGCLKSISFCDETIIIDDYSSDKTLNLARKFKVKIFKRRLNNDYTAQRNFGLAKAKGDWVLFVDADERVSGSFRKEIIDKIKNTRYNGFYIKREDIFLGKKMRFGEFYNIKFLRLARKNTGKWFRPIHEVWKIEGESGEMTNPLLHNSHKTIKELFQKIDSYSTINANFMYSNKVSVKAVDVFLYPGIKFIHNFVLKLGFLDGIYGFIFSVFMSIHSFLTRAKLYVLQQKNNH